VRVSGSGTEQDLAARRRRHPLFDFAAMAGIGVVIVGAALLPALTANAGGTTTIRGDVQSGSQPVSFIQVGFWSPTAGVVTSTLADSAGRFTLDVPAAVDGYAFAGIQPDAYSALVVANGRSYLRGVIGDRAASPTSTPLYQGWNAATAQNLAGGAKSLHFQLQQPGRLTGLAPVAGGTRQPVQIRRLDGSIVQSAHLDGRGAFTSEPLAPGTYAVAVMARPPYLPQAVQATVRSGRATPVALGAPVLGATMRGTIRSDGKPSGAGVPVLLQQNGRQIAATTTDASGAYTFRALAAGSYEVVAGRYPGSGTAGASGGASTPVPIAGRTPTASPTPSPSPSPTSASPGDVDLRPIARTSDAYLPATVAAEVPEALGEVAVDVALEPAGRIRGRVTGGSEGVPVQVVAEDTTTHQVLRSAHADGAGVYSLGGLVPGRPYQVYAVDRPDDLGVATFAGGHVVATTKGAALDLSLETPALTLTGRLGGGGSVVVGDPDAFSRSALTDKTGEYRVAGLVPGAYPVQATTTDRLPGDPVVVDLTDSASRDLGAGPRPATYKAWFISGGAAVEHVHGTASAADGNVVRIGPLLPAGNARVTHLAPGTYSYDPASFLGTVPAADGPWWFGPPAGTFTLRDGATTDVGPVVLHVYAR
jgi:hypothetical protein